MIKASDTVNMKEIEIDVDGVLANMDGSYANYVKDLLPDFSEEKYIVNWDMPEVRRDYPNVFKRIESLWTDPCFIANLPRYPKVEDGLKELGRITKGKAHIIIHTHIFTDDAVYESRDKWLKDLRKKTKVPFDIEISVGNKKNVRRNTYILIEDNVFNLRKSNAKYKILIRRGHNRRFGANDLGDCEGAFVCKSFFDSVKIVDNILKGVV